MGDARRGGRGKRMTGGLPDRAVLSLFLPALVAGMAFVSLDELGRVAADQRDVARGTVAAAWVLSAAAVVALQLWHWRRGTLFLRDPDRRKANRARIRSRCSPASLPTSPPTSSGSRACWRRSPRGSFSAGARPS